MNRIATWRLNIRSGRDTDRRVTARNQTDPTFDQAAAPTPAEERGERIAKWLARAGVASRRDAEKLIAEGKVRLNNTVVTHPATFMTPGDLVLVGGKLVDTPQRTRLWRYHKPDGLMTTHRYPRDRGRQADRQAPRRGDRDGERLVHIELDVPKEAFRVQPLVVRSERYKS
jgi:hypothetical protein